MNKANSDESRREFLKTAGKLAVYTPPAMVALLQPSVKAVAQSLKLKGNNGLGQRADDPQPPGLLDDPDLWNDKPTSVPGSPNNMDN